MEWFPFRRNSRVSGYPYPNLFAHPANRACRPLLRLQTRFAMRNVSLTP